jgi:cytochrome b561
MAAPDTLVRYDAASRIVHWLVFVLICVQYLVVAVMPELEEGEPIPALPDSLVSLHISIGVTIAALVAFRIAWSLVRKAPPLPADMPRWQRAAARGTQHSLNLILLLLPAAGNAWASSYGWPVTLFGLVQMPALVAKGTAPELFGELHEILANLMLLLAGVHVVAAVYHQLVLRDRLIETMLPGRGR